MDIAVFGFPWLVQCLVVLGPLNASQSRGQAQEDRIEQFNLFGGAADHHAIASRQAPDAAGHTDIEVVDAPLRQQLGAPDIVLPEAVPAVDDDVTRLRDRRDFPIVFSVISPAGNMIQ